MKRDVGKVGDSLRNGFRQQHEHRAKSRQVRQVSPSLDRRHITRGKLKDAKKCLMAQGYTGVAPVSMTAWQN